jgi:hypothetical protein
MKALKALFLAAVLAGASGGVALADIPTVSSTFSFTAANQFVVLPLSGQSSCAVTVTSVGGGVTLVPNGSSDNGTTYTVISGINSGSISATGVYIAQVASAALTNIQLKATALTSGTVTGTVTCSAAVVQVLGGGGVALSPGSQQSGFINVSGNITAGGQYFFGAGAAGSLDYGLTNASATTLGTANSTNYANGSFVAYASGTTLPTVVSGVIGSSLTASTGELVLGGATIADTCDFGITNSNQLTCTRGMDIQAPLKVRSGAGGFVDSVVPPTYTHTGGTVANTMHNVLDTVTAAGTTTTITFTNQGSFNAATSYVCNIADDTVATAVPAITYISATSFSFPSVSTNVYEYFCSGI